MTCKHLPKHLPQSTQPVFQMTSCGQFAGLPDPKQVYVDFDHTDSPNSVLAHLSAPKTYKLDLDI